MYLLIEFVEGFSSYECQHLSCVRVEDDYYNPVVLCNSKEDLIQWVKDNRQGSNMRVNGDAIYVEHKSWQGVPKGTDLYYMLPVEMNKAIVY
jgi:hypothetical protein